MKRGALASALLVLMLLASTLSTGPAATAAAPAALARYVVDSAASELRITFTQAGARSQGRFRKFSAELRFDASKGEVRSLAVSVQTTSLDTQDKERDQLLRGAELFDVKRFPTASFQTTSVSKRVDGGYEVRGKLRIRDVTRDIRLPFTLTVGKSTISLRGSTRIQRLDFGVGQGDWKSTEWVANEVLVDYSLRLLVTK